MLKGITRTIILGVKRHYKLDVIKVDSAMLPWALRHAAFVYTRFQVLRSGRTAWEHLEMTRYNGTLLEFGECVQAKQAVPMQGALDSPWITGVWLGRSTGTGEHLVGSSVGMVMARSVKPYPIEQAWNLDLFNAMVWTPWMTSEAATPIGEDFEPTEGCKACEEERHPIRRRGRPKNHTPACLQRRAELRLAARAPGIPRALYPAETWTGPLPGVVISSPASSSSNPNGSQEARAGVKRDDAAESGPLEEPNAKNRRMSHKQPAANAAETGASGAGDVDMGEVSAIIAALAKIERNEEVGEYWDQELGEEEKLELKGEELDRFEDYSAYTPWPRDQVAGPVLDMVWVIECRSGGWKACLCARPFKQKSVKTKDELYCPTPMPLTIRALLIYAALHGLQVRLFDISRAFLHTPIQEDVFIERPAEWPKPDNCVWKMNCTVYGLKEAMVDFDTHFDNVVVGEGENELKMVRLISEPGAWSSKDVVIAKHVDDGICVGTPKALDETLGALGKSFLLKVTPPLEGIRVEKFLGCEIKSVPGGFAQRVLQKTIQNMLSALQLENASTVTTPGVASEAKVPEEDEIQEVREKKKYRKACGIALYVGHYRPECQYAMKECSRGMQNPTLQDVKRLKRVGRYLKGAMYDWIMLRPSLPLCAQISSYSDSDFAADKVGRKSTTGVVVTWAGAYLTSYARTQGTVALSVGEAEGYALASEQLRDLVLRV